MSINELQPPDPEELEISIFGPGYGEAIALHIGQGKWILIDSCLTPFSDKPAPLYYLQQLNIDVSKAVRLIVATHWHDDHFRGISTLFDECKTAEFVISGALKSKEFCTLVELFSGYTVLGSSGLNEFAKVFQILEERKEHGAHINPPKHAYPDRPLYRETLSMSIGNIQASVHSLSPSDSSVLQAGLDFVRMLPTSGERKKRVLSPTPNQASVVLWVEIDDQKILLGADLEKVNDTKAGWTVILNESNVVSGKAEVYKVPHHGAESAHEPRVWSDLLSEQPIAILSPFSLGGTYLPTKEDVQRLVSLTPKAYITAAPVKRRTKWAQRVVREFVEGVTKDMRNIYSGCGQIRLRRDLVSSDASYQLELFGDATELKPEAWPN
jgi:hypothetical protein